MIHIFRKWTKRGSQKLSYLFKVIQASKQNQDYTPVCMTSKTIRQRNGIIELGKTAPTFAPRHWKGHGD